MTVQIVRLLTGEDLLGKIMPSGSEIVRIQNPVRVVVMPNKIDPKTPNVGFAPWAEFSEQKTFDIDKRHVLCIIEPIKEFINQYNTMFGGLVLPKNSNLIVPGA
jgi:hypothetical protein